MDDAASILQSTLTDLTETLGFTPLTVTLAGGASGEYGARIRGAEEEEYEEFLVRLPEHVIGQG